MVGNVDNVEGLSIDHGLRLEDCQPLILGCLWVLTTRNLGWGGGEVLEKIDYVEKAIHFQGRKYGSLSCKNSFLYSVALMLGW